MHGAGEKHETFMCYGLGFRESPKNRGGRRAEKGRKRGENTKKREGEKNQEHKTKTNAHATEATKQSHTGTQGGRV